jgi:hypothetical protein
LQLSLRGLLLITLLLAALTWVLTEVHKQRDLARANSNAAWTVWQITHFIKRNGCMPQGWHEIADGTANYDKLLLADFGITAEQLDRQPELIKQYIRFAAPERGDQLDYDSILRAVRTHVLKNEGVGQGAYYSDF